MANLFQLSDWCLMASEPFMPISRPNPDRNDAPQAGCDIIHALETACRRCDRQTAYDPSTTNYNHFDVLCRSHFQIGSPAQAD